MKVVVGLGNPGEKFRNARHNIGFLIVDRLFERLSEEFLGEVWHRDGKLDAEVASLDKSGLKVLFVKPQLSMNISGEVVKRIMVRGSLSLDDLLVVHDDLDLTFGEFRLQFDHGSAGHKGVQSIFDRLGSKSFWRLRVGIGRPEADVLVEEYVLRSFKSEELTALQGFIDDQLTPVVGRWLESGAAGV